MSPATPTTTSPTRASIVLALVLASYLMIVLDISIVITALPQIQAGLGFTAAGLSWVHNAYTLAFGGLLLLGARAGDLLGRRRLFITGLALFTGASLAIGLAPTAAVLVGARAVQGAGAAVLAPATLALLATHFPAGPGRTRSLGLYGATAGVGASLGLVVGGLLAGALSWRVGFFINLPIGAALLWVAHRHVVESPRVAGRLDVPGAVSSTLGMVALVFGLVRVAEAGWGDALAQSALVAAALALAFFLRHVSRAAQPLLPLRLLADRARSGALLARLLFLGGMIGFWFFTTQWLQRGLGFSPFQAGLAFLPATLTNFAAALAVPRLTRRIGNARLLAAGLGLALAGLAWLSCLSASAGYVAGAALPMLLVGVGQGLSLSPLTVAGVARVAAGDAGAASGLVNLAHQLGSSLGLAVLIVVATAAGPDLAHRVGAALTGSAWLMAAALAVVLLTQFHRGARAPTRVFIKGIRP